MPRRENPRYALLSRSFATLAFHDFVGRGVVSRRGVQHRHTPKYKSVPPPGRRAAGHAQLQKRNADVIAM